jgi:four helix bundle protein
MDDTASPPRRKHVDIHDRAFEFACEIVRAVEFLHRRGPIARALSYQILDAGTSVGANLAEADDASSRRDFVNKARIALREAKETRFRLRVCRRRGYLDDTFEALVNESDQLVRIIATIIRNTLSGGSQ